MASKNANPEPTMTFEEISELMRLNSWTRADLAAKLGLSKNLVDRWFVAPIQQRRRPSPAVCDQMRKLLDETKDQLMQQWTAAKQTHAKVG